MEQYGVRLSEADMSWREFIDLLSCLSADTALGRVVTIRSEDDKEIISKFNKAQRKIYDDWHGSGSSAGNIDDLFRAFGC